MKHNKAIKKSQPTVLIKMRKITFFVVTYNIAQAQVIQPPQ